MALVIRNTFFDFVDEAEAATAKTAVRRSASVPCAWKPQFTKGGEDYVASDASTSASNCDDSERISERNWDMPMDGVPQSSAEVSPVMSPMGMHVTLPCGFLDQQHMEYLPAEVSGMNLGCDAAIATQNFEHYQVPMDSSGLMWAPTNFEPQTGPFPSVMAPTAAPFTPCASFGQRSRLSSAASSFTPASSAQGECDTIVGAAKLALLNCPNVATVKVDDCKMGALTTIVAETRGADAAETKKVLDLTKTALLQAAANSSNAYVLGYTTTPFKDLLGCGFKATLGIVRPEASDCVCWDTYQKGFCPRRATCRWVHPEGDELLMLRVVLKHQSVASP